MKLSISLTAVCLFMGLSSSWVNAAAPSHIVKLKAANVKHIAGNNFILFSLNLMHPFINLTLIILGFESSSFIKNHYTTFQKGIKGGSKVELMAASIESPDNVKNIDIGYEFKAVAGTFNPAFVDYLSKLEDVEYVEPNHVYKSAILPAVSKPQPYVASSIKPVLQRRKNQKRSIVTYDVPSWGLGRINHHESNDLSSYTIDEAAGYVIFFL